jgi:hypothetical protein
MMERLARGPCPPALGIFRMALEFVVVDRAKRQCLLDGGVLNTEDV